MRYNELLSSYSVGDSLIFEMFTELKSRRLLENNTNYIEYINYINQEKLDTISHQDLISNNIYFPIGFQSVPTGEIIFIKYSPSPQKYLNTQLGKLYFILNGKSVDYPLTRKIGDGILDTLVYANLHDLENFILSLKLKFSSWDIRMNII